MKQSGLDERSKHLRRLIIKTLAAGGRGHLGPAFSLVEILRVLYDDVMSYDPSTPDSPSRDRFILSKGHGCAALYAMLADKGFIDAKRLNEFCQFGGLIGGHPENVVPGVEFSTGSLGHGLPVGIGMALYARHVNSCHRVFVVLGDGECNEGSVWEAALSAGKHGLSNLIAIIDYNKSQAYGDSSYIQNLAPLADKWESFGWETLSVQGHDLAALRKAFANAANVKNKPVAIICDTVKGKGIAFTENNMQWHHKNKINEQTVQELLTGLQKY